MLARKGEMKQLPHDARKLLPKDWTAKRIVTAIKARHPAIAHLMGIDLGMSLMFRDSEILMAVLEQLADRNIVFLPVHDSVLVKQAAVETVVRVMQDVTRNFVGFPLPLKVETC